jgi:hypothetical protein
VKPFIRVAIATALSVVCLCASGAFALASPGQHLWADVVHTSDVFEDEAATALTVTPAGCPVVVGDAITSTGGAPDIRHVSYDALTSLWRWNTAPTTSDGGGADTAAGVVHAGGFDYVAGTTQAAGTNTDYVVLKLDDVAGARLWTASYDGPAHGADEAEALAADAAGNVYVTGGSSGAGGSMDVATVKIRPDGSTAWARRFNGRSGGIDRGLAIAVRGSSVYVAGISNRPGHADDVVLIKYSAAGALRWVRFFDDTRHRSESVSGIAVTAAAVYVCGGGGSGVVAPGDALLLKYSPSGALQWRAWAGAPGGDDSWSDLAVDGLGRIHLTGTFFRAATADDITTAVYSPSGRLKWRCYLSSPGRRLDAGSALAVDTSGTTYVCGSIGNAAGNADMAVLAYNAIGITALWWTRYPDAATYPAESDLGDDFAYDIALASGALYVAGSSTAYHLTSSGESGDTSRDFITLKIGL